jgi:hypothetical protein
MEKSFVGSTDRLRRDVVRRRLLFPLCLAGWMAALVALSGCHESPYELARVRGTVTIDSQPLTFGRVMFAPTAKGDGIDAGKPALGPLQPDGTFVLTTYQDGDGAVVGDHWVTVIGGGRDQATATPGVASAIPPFTRFTVPTKQTVVAGQENEIDIRVTAQDVKRFSAD